MWKSLTNALETRPTNMRNPPQHIEKRQDVRRHNMLTNGPTQQKPDTYNTLNLVTTLFAGIAIQHRPWQERFIAEPAESYSQIQPSPPSRKFWGCVRVCSSPFPPASSIGWIEQFKIHSGKFSTSLCLENQHLLSFSRKLSPKLPNKQLFWRYPSTTVIRCIFSRGKQK